MKLCIIGHLNQARLGHDTQSSHSASSTQGSLFDPGNIGVGSALCLADKLEVFKDSIVHIEKLCILDTLITMAFGYGVGDFLAVGQLAWTVYKSCKDAPESFGNISQEVLSLHVVIKEFEDNVSGQTLTAAQQAGLKTVGDGCRNVLQELQSLVVKYESLGSKSKRTWDRVGWALKDIT